MAKRCVCSVIPPHMLLHIAGFGPQGVLPGQKTATQLAALNTLNLTARLQGQRSVLEKIQNLEVQPGHEYRVVFDCQHGQRLPGRQVVSEGGRVPSDPEAREAYNGADVTYKLYQLMGRNGIDGNGMRMVSSVKYSRQYDNAFWNGRQMIYGSGDGILFLRFTAAVDVIGHELTHGVTQFTTRLDYQDQPGALNESISDCFGSMVKQYALGQTVDVADWLIGAGLFVAGVHARGIRDMLNPGTAYNDPQLGADPQPAHMRDYQQMADDNGGVHINSGIPNRAFALACQAIGGKAWEGAGKVWYNAITAGAVPPDSDFQTFAGATVDAAGKLFGPQSKQADAVSAAWATVGVL